MNIVTWLRELGLERYELVFRENEVDWEVLPELTEGDLEKLGLPLGPRKKLLKAIASLEEFATGQTAAQVSAPAAASSAERRQLTVMFVDLVGSTELSRRLDPEDMGDVVRAYHSQTTGIIRLCGGHVAKYLGDGVLAYFGWPQAHEDDAERAVRAGLGLAQAIAEVDDGAGGKLAVRIGIATGPVVVGELIGEGASQEQAVVGETPNLAARLQATAPADGVAISVNTRSLLGDLFELEQLGEQRLKGFENDELAFRVIGEGRSESRFEATRGRQLTPLVGREHELGLLLERWSRAKDGEGQVVLLSGEAGIGKSRLIKALRERIRDDPHVPLPHYGSAYHTSSAFHPVVRHLERAAGFARNDPPAIRLDKLEALIRASSHDLSRVMPLIAPLLGLDSSERYAALDAAPQQRRQLTLEALVGQVEGLAEQRPVLAIYEDVHWFDPTTLDVISSLVEAVARLRVLVLITFRPDFRPPWPGHSHVTALSLSRLARRDGAEVLARLVGDRRLPKEVENELLAKTDGVPLFLEELTKAVIESGLLDQDRDGYGTDGTLRLPAIPSSLHDSLMARLDRLAPIREIAQVASVIGREFAFNLLAAVAGRSHSELADGLEQLEKAELIYRRGLPPDASYSFKHALVQDAAYQSLLKSRRQQLHAQVARSMEECFPEAGEQMPELLARHFRDGGLPAQAINYFYRAGCNAASRSAFKESAEHLSQALELLARANGGPEHFEQELRIRTALGPALIATRGFASEEVGCSYERARELCSFLGDDPRRFPALWGSWVFHTVRAELLKANELGETLLELAQQADDQDLLLQAHHALETSLFWCGQLARAQQHMRLGLAIYDSARHREHAATYGGHDPAVCCLAFQAFALWLSGFHDQAERARHEALALADRLQQPGSRAHAEQLSLRLQVARRDVAAVKAEAGPLYEAASQHGFPHPLAIACMSEGWALALRGDVDEGLEQLSNGIGMYDKTGARLARSGNYGMLAEALSIAGRIAEALRQMDVALDHVAVTDERVYEADLLRLKSALLLRSDRKMIGEVEAGLRQSLAVARGQGAKAWELRTAGDLARLWAEQGERQKAHDLLAPVYGWFTEGFDTPDLIEAKHLLDDL